MDNGNIITDQDRSQPWGLGRWFYFREGRKNRLNRKALNIAIVIVFTIALVMALFSDGGTTGTSHSKSASIETPNIADISVKPSDLPALKAVDLEVERIPQSVNTHRKPTNPVLYGALEKVDYRKDAKIPPGTMIRVRLMSGASNGPVRALMIDPIKIEGSTIIDAGNLLLGQGQSTPERLMVKFSQLVFKDGTYKRIIAEACDTSDKMPGLLGSNVRGVALKWAGAAGLGVLGGAAMGMQERQEQGSNKRPSTRDAMLNGVAVASLEQAKQISSDIENTEPLIEVPDQTEFYVLFAGE